MEIANCFILLFELNLEIALRLTMVKYMQPTIPIKAVPVISAITNKYSKITVEFQECNRIITVAQFLFTFVFACFHL